MSGTIFNRCQLSWGCLSSQYLSWQHLSISGISQLLLTQFGPNFLDLIFVVLIFWTKFFLDQTFLDPNIFFKTISPGLKFWPNIFFTKFLFTKNFYRFFGQQIFGWFFCFNLNITTKTNSERQNFLCAYHTMGIERESLELQATFKVLPSSVQP